MVPHLEWLKMSATDVNSLETYRAKVPGGWFVAVMSPFSNGGAGVAFYPDPSHQWDGGSLPLGTPEKKDGSALFRRSS